MSVQLHIYVVYERQHPLKSCDTKVMVVCHSWDVNALGPAKQSLSSLLSTVPLSELDLEIAMPLPIPLLPMPRITGSAKGSMPVIL